MAGTDSRKQLLTLIRDFAAEKSQGERRVESLKKRIQELQSEMDIANAELEESKRSKEAAEQELKGYEVELAMNEASIQTLEARNAAIQYEVSMVGSDLGILKNEEGALRDNFIKQMMELNTTIRRFQETTASTLHKESCIATSSDNGNKLVNEQDAQVALRTLEDKLAHIISQTNMEEQEYQAEQNIHKQLQQELINIEKKVTLMEAIMKETKELQELTRYPCLHYMLLIE
ncbi:spindle assembly abnormal protein 6 [Vitis riparia]|uniref:spindle assembly abnormal protein 6 n=1 Tax=Vitis riparia TaxID=96939 RepID=UPI00155A5000|nr:spindle assembly abnormal protein 6 [Vitis riparia]